MTRSAKVGGLSAPRKDPAAHAMRDPIHVGAAFVYGRICSPKKLALAWRILAATARKYRTGAVVGALTRIAWEIDRLESIGVSTDAVLGFLHRVALRARQQKGPA